MLTAASDKFDGWKKEGMGRESEVSSICGCFGCLNGKSCTLLLDN